MVAKILETHGKDTMGGYDIGCSFQSTVLSSSLGPEFRRLHNRLCVNAFHGYSHNFACQSVHHPNVVEGIGIEDLETMERIFSASNHVAGVTRFASAYVRRMFIDMFFREWDWEKYTNLAMMLYNNYRQALDIINTQTAALDAALVELDITRDDIERYCNEECQFFSILREEEEKNVTSSLNAPKLFASR